MNVFQAASSDAGIFPWQPRCVRTPRWPAPCLAYRRGHLGSESIWTLWHCWAFLGPTGQPGAGASWAVVGAVRDTGTFTGAHMLPPSSPSPLSTSR